MIIVSFCCNNPDNGLALGKVCAIEVHGEDVGIELESPSYPDATMTFSVVEGAPELLDRCDSTLRLGRHSYGCRGYKAWCGNWCWDATRMPAVEVRRMLLELREKGWRCVASEADFGDAYDKGQDLTGELISFALSDEPSPGFVAALADEDAVLEVGGADGQVGGVVENGDGALNLEPLGFDGVVNFVADDDVEGGHAQRIARSVPGGHAAVVTAGSAVIVGEGEGAVAAGAGPGGAGVGVALVEVGAADHVPVVGAVTAPVRVEDGEQQQHVSKGHGNRVASAEPMGKRTLVTGGAACTGMGRVAI